jgi:hypothetical protein
MVYGLGFNHFGSWHDRTTNAAWSDKRRGNTFSNVSAALPIESQYTRVSKETY